MGCKLRGHMMAAPYLLFSPQLGGLDHHHLRGSEGLRSKFKVKAAKVQTENDVADMPLKCLAAPVRRRLFDEIGLI